VSGLAQSPPARAGASMAYDRRNGKLVLFGGDTMMNLLADTWLWDGAQWTQAQPTQSPPPRAGHRLEWDGQRVVLFGGHTDGGVLNDVWSWTGTTWPRAPVGPGPSGRAGMGLSYFHPLKELVVYGGFNAAGPLTDAWALHSDGGWATFDTTPGVR